MRGQFGAAGAASFVALALGAPPALAAYPGENGKIAFLRSPSDEVLSRIPRDTDLRMRTPPADLYSMNPDGSGRRRLLRRVAEAAFSPDGERLVIVRPSGRETAITLSDADGRARRVLTRGGQLFSAQFSPDGRRVVYVRVDSGRRSLERLYGPIDSAGELRRRLRRMRYGLYTIGVDGTGRRRIASFRGSIVGGASPSPAAGTVAVVTTTSRVSRIVSVGADGDVSPIQAFGLNDGAVLGGVDFSPDGTRLAFKLVSDRPGIHLVAAAGGTSRRVAGTRILDFNPLWSPDGRAIAFTRVVRRGGRSIYSHIYSVSSAGGKPTRLTGQRFRDIPVSWQPLGR
jgi:Tol biopolymer transport system component